MAHTTWRWVLLLEDGCCFSHEPTPVDPVTLWPNHYQTQTQHTQFCKMISQLECWCLGWNFGICFMNIINISLKCMQIWIVYWFFFLFSTNMYILSPSLVSCPKIYWSLLAGLHVSVCSRFILIVIVKTWQSNIKWLRHFLFIGGWIASTLDYWMAFTHMICLCTANYFVSRRLIPCLQNMLRMLPSFSVLSIW